MAIQKGALPLSGTIGGINFYFRKGKPVARAAGGGFNRQAIKTKASMVRVRENNSEFGHCSQVKKLFRVALFPFLMHYKDVTLHGRMMRLFQEIKNLDAVSGRGLRKVGNGMATAQGLALLRDFEFTPKCDPKTVVPMNGSYDADSCVYSVTGFDIRQVRFPKAATHLQLQFGVLGVDFEGAIYKLFMAEPLLFEKGSAVNSFSLSPVVLPNTGLQRFAFLGVTFYQELNGEKYVLKEEGNVGLRGV